MDRKHYDFTNKIFAFIDQPETDSVLVALKDIGVSRDHVDFLDYQERKEFIHNLEHASNPITRLRFTADKVIGSGPAEFARDLKESPEGEYLVCVEVPDTKLKDKIFDVLKKCDAHRIKYFHPMYTEHGTVEKGHRQEIFPVN